MKIRRISDGKIFEVRKYVNGFGEESVWCDDWYGHHLVGRDCEFVDTYTAEDVQEFWAWSFANGWFYGELTETWHNDQDDDVRYTINDVLKIWENERRSK